MSRAFTAFQSDAAFLRAVPVPLPSTYVKGLDFARQMQESSTVTGPPYLNGRLGIENGQKKGFKSYYLVALLYKVPLATQITVLLATLGVFLYRAPRQFWQAEAFLIVPAVVFVAVFSFSHVQIGLRYILIMFPLLFVFASRIMVRWSRSGRHQVAIGVLLGYLLISNLSYYPHYLSYFNELMPDRKLSYTVIAHSDLDWGQNTSYIVKYLQDNPDVMFFRERRARTATAAAGTVVRSRASESRLRRNQCQRAAGDHGPARALSLAQGEAEARRTRRLQFSRVRGSKHGSAVIGTRRARPPGRGFFFIDFLRPRPSAYIRCLPTGKRVFKLESASTRRNVSPASCLGGSVLELFSS